MQRAAVIACPLILVMKFLGPLAVMANDSAVAFAVVSEDPKDKARVSVRIAIEGAVSEMRLLASEQILSNLTWKKLEICHALKLEGHRSPEGFHVLSVRAIDAAMLPMVLQGFAGDCLLRKALEIAPFVD
ncbi:MAG: hypothetical protein OEY77_01445 [Nitrospira sp.]|nr:hypothetical protein [Nitrospira sp.]